MTVYDAFLQHQTRLKRYLSRFLCNPQDVEDAAQEAFLRAYNTEKGREIEQPKAFLYRIAKHIALAQLSRKSRQITDYLADFDTLGDLPGEDSAEDEFIARQTFAIHCEAVVELAPQCRRIYLMRKVYGMSHKEIAERIGIAVSTVEKHLIKGVEQCDRYVRQRTEESCSAVSEQSQARSRGEQR